MSQRADDLTGRRGSPTTDEGINQVLLRKDRGRTTESAACHRGYWRPEKIYRGEVMSNSAKRDIAGLIRLAEHASRWIDERQKDFDFLSRILDKMDQGEAIPKKERQRARAALKRLQR